MWSGIPPHMTRTYSHEQRYILTWTTKENTRFDTLVIWM